MPELPLPITTKSALSSEPKRTRRIRGTVVQVLQEILIIMSLTPRDFLRLTIGAAIFAAIILVSVHYSTNQNPGQQLAYKAHRIDLVNQIRLTLAYGSEAEKSATLALTDVDSEKYASQARDAAADVERKVRELGDLLNTRGTAAEKDLLDQFSKAFAEFRQVDKDLLALAVRNTNLKAASLAFGPAAAALKEMNDAVAHLLMASANSPEARQVAVLAFGAQTAALRIQGLLAPHIAEESDKKMDELEAVMTTDDAEVRKSLAALAAIQSLGGNTDLATATASYARFSELRKQILALSRENTNVRSFAISLNQKRQASLVCQQILVGLQQAIAAEPIPGVPPVPSGIPVKPR